ncbi:HOTHEAD-like protein [Tanacetum coccineum]
MRDTTTYSPSKYYFTEGIIKTRATIHGGGTCINAGFYSRGEAQFNKEARLMDENLVQESYKWTERVMVFEPVVQEWPSAVQAALLKAAPNYTFMHEATKAPKISFFDYIIVGGGTAGIPLATTLSAKYSVLLLERGGSPYGNANITNLSDFGNNFADTPPDSPSQIFTSSEGVINTRARVLGGGTCINAGFYSRGEAQFNKEARLMDENLVQESYKWTERVMVFEPVVQEWPSAVQAALLKAGVTPDNGFTYDHIIRTKVSGTVFDENGTRHTVADLLQYANPKGLSVLHVTVHKILFKTIGKSRPLAYGVVFEDSLRKKHRAYLKGGKKDEIILSAGALGSPQLLMLSGVGPRKQLDALKIKVVVEQPFVGQGMADNPLNAVFIPSPIAFNPSGVQIVGITRFGSYIEAAGGFSFIFTPSPNYRGFSP